MFPPALIATFKVGVEVYSVAFSPDGESILTGSRDKTAKLWSARARDVVTQPLATFSDEAMIHAVTFSPDGKRILTGSAEGGVRLWDASLRGNVSKWIANPNLVKPKEWVRAVAYSPDGRSILMGSRLGIAQLLDANLNGSLAILKDAEMVTSVAYSRNGKLIVMGSNYGTAKLWSLLDAEKVSLAAAQIVLYARRNKLTVKELPEHLRDELNEETKTFLSGN